MLKPHLPNIPGVGAVADTLDFVKNLWGSMSIPGMPSIAAPTMSVDELDKKIADLKAVESWLNVNVSMLRGTIQALEVQRGTIATLKSMGATLANAVKQPGADQKSVLAAAPYASAFFSQPAPEPKPAAALKPEAVPATPPPANVAVNEGTAPAAGVPEAGAAPGAPMANPVVWWNMLQDQFKQAVTTAMSSDAMAGASALAQDAANKLTAASAESAAKLGKAMVKATAPSGAAKAGGKPAAKPAPRKAAAKRAPAKPGVAKQK